jgi:hypothetical protein
MDKLVVRNEAWDRPRGGHRLGFIWGPNISIECILRPRVLHLDTQCYDQHLITVLKTIPQVEELILGLVRVRFMLGHHNHKGIMIRADHLVRRQYICGS